MSRERWIAEALLRDVFPLSPGAEPDGEASPPPAFVPPRPALLDAWCRELAPDELDATFDWLLEAGGSGLVLASPFALESLRAFVPDWKGAPGYPGPTRGRLLEALGLGLQVACVVDQDPQAIALLTAQTGAWSALRTTRYAFPSPVAGRLRAADRGTLALALLRDLRLAPPSPQGILHWFGLAGLWRDGVRATAQLWAALRPEAFSEGTVPATSRPDLLALRAAWARSA